MAREKCGHLAFPRSVRLQLSSALTVSMLAFLALLGAPYIYDISSLRVKCLWSRNSPRTEIIFWLVGEFYICVVHGEM